jgi:hypothetical protein
MIKYLSMQALVDGIFRILFARELKIGKED